VRVQKKEVPLTQNIWTNTNLGNFKGHLILRHAYDLYACIFSHETPAKIILASFPSFMWSSLVSISKLYRQIGASLGDTTLNTTLSPSFPSITCQWLAMAIQAGQHTAVM